MSRLNIWSNLLKPDKEVAHRDSRLVKSMLSTQFATHDVISNGGIVILGHLRQYFPTLYATVLSVRLSHPFINNNTEIQYVISIVDNIIKERHFYNNLVPN